MYLKKLFFSTLLSLTLLQAQNSVGLNINGEDLEILASVNINSLAGYSDSTSYIIDASYLHSDGDNMSTIGVSGESSLQGVEGLYLAFGAKLIIADSFLAVPLFGKASYVLPLNDSVPTTSLITTFAYAPSVLTYVDGESYSEFRIEADMEVISNIHLFTGYRNIDTEYNNIDKSFNDSIYAGMKLSF